MFHRRHRGGRPFGDLLKVIMLAMISGDILQLRDERIENKMPEL